MSDKYKIWKRVAFWENIKKTIAIFAAPGVVGLHQFGAADHWMIIAGSFSFLGAALAIWFCDNNNNGIVDLFDDK
jgi:hypothetical protein